MKNLSDTPIIHRYIKGDVIISEGIYSNNAYIILEGDVQVSKKVDKKTVIVNQLGKGDVFGEMGLISRTVRSANVTAMNDVTIGIISLEQFESLLNDLPKELKAIISALVERLRFTTEKLSNIGVQLETTRDAVQSYSIKPDSEE